MMTKIIRTEKNYRDALERLGVLMDAAPGSSEEEELELLSILVEKYEEEHFPIDLPDPVEAIKFRMEQQGLTRKDLIQYIGSQSKVSEVLNRKKPLSLTMIRALHAGLGIPAEVLLKEPGKQLAERRYDPEDYPLREMFSEGYFPEFKTLRLLKERAEEILDQFFSPLDSLKEQMVLCRSSAPVISNGHAVYSVTPITPDEGQSTSLETNFVMDENSLRAWQARVLQICESQNIPRYSESVLTEEFLRGLVHLSVFPNGPLLAEKVLLDSGIHFVILPHLPKTYLDGACFTTASGRPVVALTLRHDRLDNFWFTLIHELSHVFLHLSKENFAFFDETEHGLNHVCNSYEDEANHLCVNLLIPDDIWLKENLLSNADPGALLVFSRELGISPSIVAGRLRWESGNYALFNDLLGIKTLKRLFLETNK